MNPGTTAAVRRPARQPNSSSPARGRRRSRNLIRSVVLVVGLLLTPEILSATEREKATEYQLKAAFLYNFAKFVEWPEEAFETGESPFVVAVVGKDPFGEDLDQLLEGKEVGERRIAVVRFPQAKDVDRCHILFVPDSESPNLVRIRKSLAGQSVLMIGETRGFAEVGGIVNFFLEKSKLRFEVNPEAARRAKLTISSKLLRLARIVEEKKEERQP